MDADHDHWTQLSALLDELIDADAAGRDARLAEVRIVNAALADEVASLLQRQVGMQAARFLEDTAISAEFGLAGRKVGPYTLRDRSAMAAWGSSGWRDAVMAASRRGRGQVPEPGSVGHCGEVRFRAKAICSRGCRINIARLLDAGVAADNRIWCSNTRRRAIDRWCDERRLASTRDCVSSSTCWPRWRTRTAT